ncbi:glycosyltransferase [Demequina phytophila]|uniref:glycosyltransferase n=1 Tax=Demequina phytophila TaxID=1638981 RepID=UPI0009E51FEB|nr:glycosyltransferase [Demequina phytophila]
MRILQVGGLAGPDAVSGGVWTVALGQTRALRELGYSVELVGSWLGRVPDAEQLHAEAVLLHARTLFPGAGLRGLYSPGVRATIEGLAADVDVAHVHLSRDYLTTTAVRTLNRLGVPIVAQCHGMIGPPRSLSTRMFDKLNRDAYLDSIGSWLTLTDVERSELADYGVARSTMQHVTNSVSADGLPTRNPQGMPTFVFVSRLEQRKQPEVFVRAGLEVLRGQPNVRFVIAGPDQGSLRAVERLIAESGHEQAFDIRGALQRDDVMALLASSSAMVLPSVGEIAPMVVIEGAALGTPMIITEDCGLEGTLRATDSALVVKPVVADVAEAMMTILADVASAEAMGARARILYESEWSPAATTDVLIDTYATAIAEARAR